MKRKHILNRIPKYFSACMLATAALLGGTSPAWAQDPAGTAPGSAASGFSVLGATVTCTTSVIAGDVGIAPATAFTNTGCTIAGGMPPATNAAAVGARVNFLSAYDAARSTPCTTVLPSTITGPMTLSPGVYCTDAALTGTGVLTLDGLGDANAVWIFNIGTLATGALTGTNFTVVMAGGGQPCNVTWAPSAAVTMTTSVMQGNLLAGNAIDGSITLTGGSLAGSAMANVAVTMTDTSVIGCGVLSDAKSCKGKKHHGHKKEHKKCDQGVGNGAEGCDPGDSNHHHGSNDEDGGKPGDPGRR
jgi:Ice-binding-like